MRSSRFNSVRFWSAGLRFGGAGGTGFVGAFGAKGEGSAAGLGSFLRKRRSPFGSAAADASGPATPLAGTTSVPGVPAAPGTGGRGGTTGKSPGGAGGAGSLTPAIASGERGAAVVLARPPGCTAGAFLANGPCAREL